MGGDSGNARVPVLQGGERETENTKRAGKQKITEIDESNPIDDVTGRRYRGEWREGDKSGLHITAHTYTCTDTCAHSGKDCRQGCASMTRRRRDRISKGVLHEVSKEALWMTCVPCR